MGLSLRLKRTQLFIVGLILSSCAGLVAAQVQPAFVVNYRVETVANDGVYDYYLALIKLALDATTKDYGPYQLTPLFDMNFPRAKLFAKSNSVPNLLMGTSYSKEFAQDYAYIPFPIDFGVMSYRVCFTSEAKIAELKNVKNLDELKHYSIGQGKSWLDNAVLRSNGFKVVELASYNTLFSSVARDRFDLFCRSIIEILPEWRAHKKIEGLAIEQSFALYYVFPRFFWTNKSNSLLLERMNKGMTKIYEDGSAFELWKKHNQESIDFSHLDQRHIFYLDNPQLQGVDRGFEKYFFHPSKVQ